MIGSSFINLFQVNECVDSILEIEKEINENLLIIRKEYDDAVKLEDDENNEEFNDKALEESIRQWELRKGIVSNSPEFQKFMMKLLETDL